MAPASSPVGVTDRVVETHCSTLFFVDDLVYKRKKPLDLGFLDFRTVDSRRRACEQEVAVNRRLAPDVYLGVATLLAPDGQPCDSLVVMRRLPDERRLARCVVAGEQVGSALTALATQLAALHRASPAPAHLREVATPAALTSLWDVGLDVLAQHEEVVGAAIREQTRSLARSYLAGRSPLLELRVTCPRSQPQATGPPRRRVPRVPPARPPRRLPHASGAERLPRRPAPRSRARAAAPPTARPGRSPRPANGRG